MKPNRLEALSDGVIAIIITIMVLEMKVPQGDSLGALQPLVPVFLSYVLSFVYLGIFWNNHHHMLHACKTVSGPMLWANLHLLFWLSLAPFVTAWMGESHLAAAPTAVYGMVLLMAALAYLLLQQAIIASEGEQSVLKVAVGTDWKGKLSPVLYVVAIAAAFWSPWVSATIYVVVALTWLVPDSRIQRALARQPAAALVILLATAGCQSAGTPVGRAATTPADLVLIGGRLVTVDPGRPEAQALAVRGDRIIAVGTNEEIRRHIGGGTRVIDLAGRLLIPGFIEGHGHYTGLGESKTILDLTTARSWDDIVAMVRDAATRARQGEWIRGRGWHQEKWTSVPTPNVDGVPLHTALSAASPNNPVELRHASGHASFVNAKAMELAGIDRTTANPPGGEIIKDASGNPTGLLRETAQRLIGQAQGRGPQPTPEERDAFFRRVVRLAGEEALSKVVTSFHDAGSSFATVDGFKRLADRGELPVRLYVMLRRESNDALERRLPEYRLIGYGNNFLTVRSIKRQIDGALGAHGAWLLEPYTDMPTSTGLTLESPDDIARTAEIAIRHGFQVNTHAIGDRANREVLDIYERTFRANPDRRDLRWRIEHAQHLQLSDVPRFRRLGVIASMQGIHATSDGPWIPKRLGEARARATSYLFRTLLDSGVVVTNGTDVPVEDIDPIASFYAAVSKRMRDGSRFVPEQRMTREEALRSYTMSNAYAAFEEGLKGSITPGKLADLVVLSKDIMRVPEDEIPTARVDLTILGGRVRYERGAGVTP